MIERLKALVADARAAARRGLEADHSGRRCAAGLSHFQDELIRVLFDYTRRARVPGDQPVGRRAHVDRRHRRLRPRAAGAWLRHRSAVPASLQEDGMGRERRRVHALHSVGSRLQGRARDPHRRSMHQDERRHHRAHGPARCAADPRRRAALRRIRGAFPHRGGGTARRAPSSTPRWRNSMRGTGQRARAATRWSPTSRTARAACATCIRCTGCRSTSTARASARRRSPPASSARRKSTTFRRCEDFLWTIRCFLHFLSGRPEEVLTFDVQPWLAAQLGYHDRGGLIAVERFMKHYFLVAKDVGDLTTILCSALEMQQLKSSPGLEPLPAAAELEAAPAAAHAHRLPHRQRPAERRRPGRFQARSGEPHPLLRRGAPVQLVPASRRDPAVAPVEAADRRQAARQSRGEPHLRRIADRRHQPRDVAAAHERGGRARPFRARSSGASSA